ncbi:MAG: hypothetical protein GY913_22595 [Proteobacteria bacterium]|nr:hypothetical protein [Pseudomonadota bacterium]MCP4919700.1 hypothetical protein [Pseudomonadota bacterium]
MSGHAPQLYQRAELYDLIYSDKAYDRESARLVDHLHELGVPGGGSVLEGCCGTGDYLCTCRTTSTRAASTSRPRCSRSPGPRA